MTLEKYRNMNPLPTENNDEDPHDRHVRLERERYNQRSAQGRPNNLSGYVEEDPRIRRNRLARERRARNRAQEQEGIITGNEGILARRSRHARERRAQRTAEQRRVDITVS